MKNKILTIANSLITLILAVIGFSSCGDDNGKYDLVEYGTPTTDFNVTGKVTDSNGKPIKGIQVTVINGETSYKPYMPKVYTDENGNYTTKDSTIVWIRDDMRVEFDDVDGEANGGEFAKDSVVKANMKQHKIKEGKGWYQGKYLFTANKTLKKK